MREATSPRLKFSQRHPFLFGLMLILMAMALFTGVMAMFGFGGKAGSVLSKDTPLGIVNVQGMIANVTPIIEFMDELRRDEDIKGVLLRVDSPGGLVAPSQELFQAVKRLEKAKPVVASFGNVAASGGYYAAAPSTFIVANPASITGSIGVKMELADLQGLMEKIGVGEQLIASGKFKGTGTPFRPLTPEERAYLTDMVMDLHDQFVTDVAESRNMTKASVEAVADGRAFTGRQALSLGLVDELGSREAAIGVLKRYCHLTGTVGYREGPVEKVPLLKELLGSLDIQVKTDLLGPRWMLSY